MLVTLVEITGTILVSGVFLIYRQISNITPTLIGNKIVHHSDVVGASPAGAAPTTSSFSTLTPDFNRLHRDIGKMRRETFKFCDLVRLILEILQ